MTSRRSVKEKKMECFYKCTAKLTDDIDVLKKCPSQTLHGCDGSVYLFVYNVSSVMLTFQIILLY
jgi:hypothetical protein